MKMRVMVVLTSLFCLGVAGYAGQAWWARRYAEYNLGHLNRELVGIDPDSGRAHLAALAKSYFSEWHQAPWYGEMRWFFGKGWKPKRTYWELAKLATDQDLPNDPDAWEAWFKAHPDLVWDDKLKRLVEKP